MGEEGVVCLNLPTRGVFIYPIHLYPSIASHCKSHCRYFVDYYSIVVFSSVGIILASAAS